MKKKESDAQKKAERAATVTAIRNLNAKEKSNMNEENLMHPTMVMTDNVMDKAGEVAGDVITKFKGFRFSRPNDSKSTTSSFSTSGTEEVNFALPKQSSQQNQSADTSNNAQEEIPAQKSGNSDNSYDLVGKDEVANKETVDDDEPPAFTIDDDDDFL